MQFNLVNDQEQVAQFVRRGMAWHGVAWRGMAWHGVAWRSVAGRGVSVRVYCGGCLKRLKRGCFVGLWGACPGRFRAVLAVSGSFAY